jgi:glycosyltransferase involved in cell wall biosynthesis
MSRFWYISYMKKTISVITVTFNDPEGLKRTLDSIAMQKTDKKNRIEVLVINGNPNNKETVELIKKYKAMGIVSPKSVSESDGGIYDAMNKGMALATGKFFNFMNGGDTFENENVLDTLMTTIDENPEIDFLYGDTVFANHNNKIWRGMPLSKSPKYMIACHQSMLFRRDVIGDQLYPEKYKICNDYQFYIDYMKKAQHPAYLPITIANFEGGGLSEKKSLIAAMECFQIRQREAKINFVENMALMAPSVISKALNAIDPSLHKMVRNLYRSFKYSKEEGTEPLMIMPTTGRQHQPMPG